MALELTYNGKNFLLKLGFLLCQALGPLLVIFAALFGVSVPLYLMVSLMSVAILFTMGTAICLYSIDKTNDAEENFVDALKFIPFALFFAALFVPSLPLSHLLVAVGMIALSTGSLARNLFFLASVVLLCENNREKQKNPLEGWGYFFTCNLLYLSSSVLIILALFSVLPVSQSVLITLFSLLGLVAILASDVIRFQDDDEDQYKEFSAILGTFAGRAATVFEHGIAKALKQDFSNLYENEEKEKELIPKGPGINLRL